MDAEEALSLVQLKMGNQPDYQYYMKVKARDIAQMKVGNQLDYRYSDMMFTDPEALSGMQQHYSLRQYAHLPAWWFYNQWVLQESGEISLIEDMLAKIKAGNEEAFEFVLRLFFNYHILPERVKERILREKFSSELDEALQAGIVEGKEKYCIYHYPPEAEACESVVDGYEFRLLRNSDEYLEQVFHCRTRVNREAPVRGDDGIWHFALFKAGELAACLEVHSVFELCYPVVCPPDVEFERARIRIAVLRWLKKHGLAERFGPYFPGDYAYLAEEGDGDCGVR